MQAEGFLWIAVGIGVLFVVYRYFILEDERSLAQYLIAGGLMRLFGKQGATVALTVAAGFAILNGLNMAYGDDPTTKWLCGAIIFGPILYFILSEYNDTQDTTSDEPLDWGRSEDRPDVISLLRNEKLQSPNDRDE